MAAGAFKPGRRVDVLVERKLGQADRRHGMTGQAAVIGRPAAEVEEDAVPAVELVPVVADKRRDGPLRVVGIGSVVDIPGALDPGGHAADLAESGGRGRRPAEVFPEDLLGPFGRVLGARRIVAAQTIDLDPAGDFPAGARSEGGFGGLGDPAAGEMPAEEEREIPGREARPGPGPMFRLDLW